jgi:hypothetical protein
VSYFEGNKNSFEIDSWTNEPNNCVDITYEAVESGQDSLPTGLTFTIDESLYFTQSTTLSYGTYTIEVMGTVNTISSTETYILTINANVAPEFMTSLVDQSLEEEETVEYFLPGYQDENTDDLHSFIVELENGSSLPSFISFSSSDMIISIEPQVSDNGDYTVSLTI